MSYSNATFFLNPEGGSDAARTALTSCTASNPSGSTTRINKTAHGLTTGAVVDLTAFSAWLNAAYKITVVDADNFDLDSTVWQATADASGTATPRGGSSFADAWKTVTSGATAARHQAGDTIRLMASPDATSLAQSATWTDNSATVTLTTAVTATVQDCEAAWTASANVTVTADGTVFATGTKSCKMAFAAGFTTGLIAYKTTSANLDLSAYQQLSFWILTTGAASTVSLKLCSGSDGATGVLATLTVPYATGGNDWTPVTIDNGSALPSGINSIGIYTSADPSTNNWYIDQIIACKAPSAADSLSLRSLIGKNSSGENYEWWPIRSIDGTTIKLGMSSPAGGICVDQEYHGTTEAVTTYKRESINLTALGISGQTAMQSGGASGYISYSGGWDRTAMTTQSGETWWSTYSTRGGGMLFSTNSKSDLKIDKLMGHLAASVIGSAAASLSRNIWIVETAASGVQTGLIGYVIDGLRVDSLRFAIAYSYGVQQASYSCKDWIVKGGRLILANATTLIYGIYAFQLHNAVWDFTDIIGADYAVNLQSLGQHTLRNTRIRRSGRGSLFACHGLRCHNCSFEDSTKLADVMTVYSMKDGQTTDQHAVYWLGGDSNGGLIQAATDQRHTASGISWKFSPLNAANITSGHPMTLQVASVAVAAGALVTAALWFRRDNTGLGMALRVPGGQLTGVPADVSASPAGSANAWEQVTITFTPTEAGVVDIVVDAWSGTTYNGWIDDFSVSQA